MFDTPNGGFFYSYIVVLWHYSRVILCIISGIQPVFQRFVGIYHSHFEIIHNPYQNAGKALTCLVQYGIIFVHDVIAGHSEL